MRTLLLQMTFGTKVSVENCKRAQNTKGFLRPCALCETQGTLSRKQESSEVYFLQSLELLRGYQWLHESALPAVLTHELYTVQKFDCAQWLPQSGQEQQHSQHLW